MQSFGGRIFELEPQEVDDESSATEASDLVGVWEPELLLSLG